MDFQSAMETFAEAWVAANTQTPLTEAAEAQAIALSRNSDGHVQTSSHDAPVEKDGEADGEGPRIIANLNRGPVPDPHQAKISQRSPASTSKSIPVHCIVEQVPNPQSCETQDELVPTIELDSYAIVPSHTMFSELVRTALFKLGYTSSDIIGAKGAIQIKNWKPLSFETITEDNDATVGEILGELTTVATLRIRLYSRPKISSANDVKEKLLQLLLTQSHSLLVSAGCPIEEGLLTLISKGGNLCEIPEDTRRRFDQWYVQQVLHHRHQLSPSLNHVTEGGNSNNNGDASVAAAHRTRMRTSFDPELELPKLHRWFAENRHPTRLQVQQYVRELNSLESRKGRKPLDVNNVVYWFKNARAAYKRAEQRQSCNGMPHSPFHDSASNDNTGRETSSEDTPLEADGGRGEAESKRSTAVEAIDLSTTHREASEQTVLANGHWKSKEGGDKGVASVKQEAGEGAVVKMEQADRTVSSDDADDDDDLDDYDMHVPAEEADGWNRKVAPCASSQSALYRRPPSSSSSSSPPSHHPHVHHSMLYMAGYMPTTIAAVLDERRKRNRTFIDPVTEVPRLEQWFAFNTHPPHSLILKYTDELNQMPYRQKFPKLEPKNVQFWFKNRRAKCKRLRLSVNLVTSSPTSTAATAAAASW